MGQIAKVFGQFSQEELAFSLVNCSSQTTCSNYVFCSDYRAINFNNCLINLTDGVRDELVLCFTAAELAVNYFINKICAIMYHEITMHH